MTLRGIALALLMAFLVVPIAAFAVSDLGGTAIFAEDGESGEGDEKTEPGDETTPAPEVLSDDAGNTETEEGEDKGEGNEEEPKPESPEGEDAKE